jgi:hypothetical protein
VKYLAVGLGVSTLLLLIITKFVFPVPVPLTTKANSHIAELVESMDQLNKEVAVIGDDAPLSAGMAVRKRNLQERAKVSERKAIELQKELHQSPSSVNTEDGVLKRTTFVMLFSGILGGVAIYIVLRSRVPEDRNSAFGVLGALVGYWLR